MKGGYQPITPIQLGNLLYAFEERRISWQAVRLALAAVEMVAIREAAKRSRPMWKKRPVVNRFAKVEFAKLTGLNPRAVSRGLGELIRTGLLEFSEIKLCLKSQPVAGAEPLIEDLSNGRGSRRLIPIPRPVLRFLAQESSATLAQVMMAYWVRGLSLQRAPREIRSRGTVKAGWIAEVFGLSLRAVRYAQARLRALNWIGKDTGSKQWKLNRDGAYFVINLDWNPLSTREESFEVCMGRARPQGLICTAGASPIEDKSSPSESKNQYALPNAGVQKLKEGRGIQLPSLSNIQPEDLRDAKRLAILHRQAIERGWIRSSEADRLKFFAAAVRARQAEGDGPRIFAGILRQGLWHHVTTAQEDEARRWVAPQQESPRKPGDLQAVGSMLEQILPAQIRMRSTSSSVISSAVRS